MKLSVNEFLVGSFQIPRGCLLIILSGDRFVMLRSAGVRILITHLHLCGRIAGVGLGQEARVNTH